MTPLFKSNLIGTLKNLKIIRKYIKKTPERKGLFLILIELISWYFTFNQIRSYFLSGIYNKSKRSSDYISPREYSKIHAELNPAYYRDLLEDKYVFDRFLGPECKSVERIFAYLRNEKIFWSSNGKIEDIKEILNYELHCFCKLNIGFGGTSVFKLDIAQGVIQINNEKSSIMELREMVEGRMYVMQKTIEQHPLMASLHPESVNTIRVITISNGEDVEVFNTLIRIGIGKNVVDNVSSGNLHGGITDDGLLFDHMIEWSWEMKYHFRHPDSEVVFRDFLIPHFDEVKRIALEAHRSIPYFFTIGWDIAISTDGPRIIEGNPVPKLSGQQVLFGGMREKILYYCQQYRVNGNIWRN